MRFGGRRGGEEHDTIGNALHCNSLSCHLKTSPAELQKCVLAQTEPTRVKSQSWQRAPLTRPRPGSTALPSYRVAH
eukprot:360023-Chlamydomonas_euryale.AAC.2